MEKNPFISVNGMAAAEGGLPEFLTPEFHVLIMTWASFFLLLAVLYKYAWKPILAGLDQREESIRQSVDQADEIHREYEEIETRKNKILREAKEEGKSIVTQSRKSAANAAKVIEEKAKSEAQIIFENSERDIKARQEKAFADLKRESADIAVTLAGKIIQENLKDKSADKKFMDKLIEDL